MEWDLRGGVALVQGEVQAGEAEALVGWVAIVLERVPAESVSAQIVERGCHIRLACHAII